MTGRAIEFAKLIEPVARELLGDPNPAMSSPKELRYGTQGSLSVDLEKGRWYDHEANEGGGLLALIEREVGVANGAAVQWLRERGYVDPKRQPERRLVATYPYCNEIGELLFEVLRYEPKKFLQRRPDGRDGRIWGLGDSRRVLYRLPQLIAAPAEALVFLTEGEKDADRLAALGLIATTNPVGGGKWRPEYTGTLNGRRVVILPDNDQKGRDHARTVMASLAAAGVRAAILELDGLPEKGDVSDWLDAGGTPGQLFELASEALERGPELPRPTTTSSSFRHDDIELVRDGKGRLVWNAANAVAVLDGHPDWQGVLAYDELAARHVLLRPLPGGSETGALPREITDADVTMVTAWFNRNGFPRASKNVAVDAVAAIAGRNQFNDCAAYLSGLVWDGVCRLDNWLFRYLGAKDSLYTREVGRRWIISAVARALQPGCKADNMLVLEGAQGVGKSSALRVLTGEAWFGDALPDMRSKDASSYLRGKWIVEVAELVAMRRSDMEVQKAFMSRHEERYRPAFGRFEVHEPRRCVFAGTTNRKDYIRDETGGRRFWPVAVKAVDLEALARDRDQLWAEAVVAFRAGEPWWLTGEVEEQAREVQSERQEDDPWIAAVSQYVSGRNEVSCKEILGANLGLPDNQMGRKESLRVAGLLQRLGFVSQGKFTSGERNGLARFVRTTPEPADHSEQVEPTADEADEFP